MPKVRFASHAPPATHRCKATLFATQHAPLPCHRREWPRRRQAMPTRMVHNDRLRIKRNARHRLRAPRQLGHGSPALHSAGVRNRFKRPRRLHPLPEGSFHRGVQLGGLLRGRPPLGHPQEHLGVEPDFCCGKEEDTADQRTFLIWECAPPGGVRATFLIWGVGSNGKGESEAQLVLLLVPRPEEGTG